MQMGRECQFAAWQPNPTTDANGTTVPSRLWGGFYGHVFVANFIGHSGGLQIKQLPQPSVDRYITAYVECMGYNHGKLIKVAPTNQRLWTSSDGGKDGIKQPLTTIEVALPGLDNGVMEVKVERLWAPDGEALTGITWAGKDWPHDGRNGAGMPEVVRQDTDTKMVKVESQVAEVTLDATSAVLITW